MRFHKNIFLQIIIPLYEKLNVKTYNNNAHITIYIYYKMPTEQNNLFSDSDIEANYNESRLRKKTMKTPLYSESKNVTYAYPITKKRSYLCQKISEIYYWFYPISRNKTIV